MSKVLKIYILSILRVRTGGIELLHQLCAELNSHRGIDAKLLYLDSEKANSDPYLNHCYDHYGCPWRINSTENETDLDEAAFIVPEVRAEYFSKGKPFENVKHKCIFWESVDNYFSAHFGTDASNAPDYGNGFKKYGFADHKDILHLVQSEYARNFLIKEAGVSERMIIDVSDYLGNDFIRAADQYNPTRNRTVIYNAGKSREYGEKLAAYMPDVKFLPLAGFSYKELAEIMHTASVYIDFGNHPGKDRMPREAAINGCLVVTGLNGAAAYEKDYPFPEECKFERIDANIPAMAAKIRDMLDNYETYYPRYETYRRMIRNEQAKFSSDVSNAINKMYEVFGISKPNYNESLFHPCRALVVGTHAEIIKTMQQINTAYNVAVRKHCEFEEPISVEAYLPADEPDRKYELRIHRCDMIDGFFEVCKQAYDLILVASEVEYVRYSLLDYFERNGLDMEQVYFVDNRLTPGEEYSLEEANQMLIHLSDLID